jgi:hypothetical protein
MRTFSADAQDVCETAKSMATERRKTGKIHRFRRIADAEKNMRNIRYVGRISGGTNSMQKKPRSHALPA